MAGLRLETSRLIIRDWAPDTDAEQGYRIYADPAVTQWIGDRRTAQTLTEARDRLQQYRDRFYTHQDGTGAWAVVEKASAQAIGTILLKELPDAQGEPTQDFEIGWHFGQASWGKGFATEAAEAIINYGFQQLGLDALYAVTLPHNHRSIRVTQRLGMTPLGLTHRYYEGAELSLFKLKRPS